MLSAGVTFLSTKQIRLWDGEIPQAATRALEGLLRIIDTALPRRLQCGLSAAQPRAPSFPHNSKEKENSFVSHAPNPGMAWIVPAEECYCSKIKRTGSTMGPEPDMLPEESTTNLEGEMT